MSLEEKIKDNKENRSFIRKAGRMVWKLGMAAATTALSTSLVGMSGVLIGGALATGGAIGGLIKKEPLYNIVDSALTSYSVINTILHPLILLGDATFPLIDNTTFLGKAARTLYASTLYNAAFVTAFRGTEHLIDHYLNPIGITKTISDNFVNRNIRIGLGFLPAYALVANGIGNVAFENFFVPQITHYGIMPNYIDKVVTPAFALNALPFGIYNQVKPLPAAKKSSYSAAYSPAMATH